MTAAHPLNPAPGAVAVGSEPELMSRAAYADALVRCSTRMRTFVTMKNPIELLVEAERMLLLKYLLDFPVNAEAQASRQRTNLFIEQAAADHLMKTGYYDDVLRDMGMDDKSEAA